jgi:hypothetical protein
MALTECVECGGKVSVEAPACPHCGIKKKKTEVNQEDISTLIHNKFFIPVVGGVFFLLSAVFATGETMIWIIIWFSMVFVFVDTTKNKIGKIPDKKGFLNLSPGMWVIATWLLWIISFPLYLIKRSTLIKRAMEYPQEISLKKIKTVTACLLVLGVLVLTNGVVESSYSNSGSPTCSDSDVRELVIDISTSELKDELLSQAIITQLGMSPNVRGNPTYEQWNQLKGKNESIKNVIDYVDKQVAEMGMTLTGIRKNGINEEIKKCQCGGDLTFSNGKTHAIEYTAQYTEDGQIYVKVFGL